MTRRDFIKSILFIAAATQVPPLVFQKRQDLDVSGSALTPEMLDRALEHFGNYGGTWVSPPVFSPSFAARLRSLL